MDRSFRLPDPGTRLPYGERRHAVRQRLHTPVYVSFNTPRSGAVLDLSELLDLHEDGFAVQTAIPTAVHDDDRLAPNRAVTLCLDLPETKKYVHGSGQVMWTDDTGRAGIRFSFLPDTSRHALKEWLFANLLVASTNHAARAGQLAQQRQEARSFELVSRASQPEPLPRHLRDEPSVMGIPDPRPSDSESVTTRPRDAESSPVRDASLSSVPDAGASPMSDQDRLLSALEDVRRQIRQILSRQGESASRDANGPRVTREVAREVDVRAIAARADAEAVINYESVLHFITERAAMFTGAPGAALALLAGERVVCRVSVGEPAPPVGSEVDISSGLSGECLRRGIVVSCRDTEADPHVDPEVCRTLGIGSFAAVPIFSGVQVIGLIEVFSPYPQSFARVEEAILERLAELVPQFGDKELDDARHDHARQDYARHDHGRLDHEKFDYEAIVRAAFAHETVAGEAVDDRTDHGKIEDLKIENAAARTGAAQTAPEQIALEQFPPEQTAPEQLPPEQTAPEQLAPDWTSAELASVIPATSGRDSQEISLQPAMPQPSTTQRPITQPSLTQQATTQRASTQRLAATPNAIQALVAERLSEQAREQAVKPASDAPEPTLAPASEPALAQTSEPALAQTSEPALDDAPEPAAETSLDNPAELASDTAEPNPAEPRTLARRFPFSHVVLLVMAIAVAAMALGYLLAPAIEQRWLRPAQSAEASSPPPTAIDRRGHALSTDELRKLADQGDPDAEWQMGILYHDGEAVPKDDALAVRWFELAAAQGYVRAQSTLGAYYWAGRGVPQDLSKAYFWSQLALAQGDEDSKSRLEGLSAQMTQAQVAAARQQAETWLRSHNQRVNSKAN